MTSQNHGKVGVLKRGTLRKWNPCASCLGKIGWSNSALQISCCAMWLRMLSDCHKRSDRKFSKTLPLTKTLRVASFFLTWYTVHHCMLQLVWCYPGEAWPKSYWSCFKSDQIKSNQSNQNEVNANSTHVEKWLVGTCMMRSSLAFQHIVSWIRAWW